jgi:nanoRNase/pAp phosphatase (c-di-AMP/oligoRNAs hydrolase)
MFDFSKEKISFRSVKKDVNVGVIAKTLHEKGGGHPPASGCPLTQDIASFFLSGVWF